jgi:hypothetical protein
VPNTTRQRFDYQPGPAALEAMKIAAQHPRCRDLGQQETLDFLILHGLWALKLQQLAPPPLVGAKRDRWRLPVSLRSLEANSEDR